MSQFLVDWDSASQLPMTATTARATLKDSARAFNRIVTLRLAGAVSGVAGPLIRVGGLGGLAAVGDLLEVETAPGQVVPAEIVGLDEMTASALPFGPVAGIRPGATVLRSGAPTLAVSDHWLGRVIDPLGRPLDGLPPPRPGPVPHLLRTLPPPAAERRRLGKAFTLGVRALDAFVPCRVGQRLAVFAGSGVGKSTLMATLAREASADVIVVGLVGERGRELREFVEDALSPAARARSVVVTATSDRPAPLRRACADAAMTVAEHFRDRGRHVLLILDSITRACHALREVGLSLGEPPSVRGYTPGVFSELPRLLERAGPGPEGAGDITALVSVLVESDDVQDPVADFIRGIVDGHIVMDRRIAETGLFPAIDVLRSLSRGSEAALPPHAQELVRRARRLLATWERVADLVRMGAYRAGADPEVDAAIAARPALERFLAQDRGQPPGAHLFDQLAACLPGEGP